MQLKRLLTVFLTLILAISFNTIPVSAETINCIGVSETSITMEKDETKTVTITVTGKKAGLSLAMSDKKTVSAKWVPKWNGNKIDIKITANSYGNCKIYIYRKSEGKKSGITLNVSVSGAGNLSLADNVTATPTKIAHSIKATGSYTNWEGVCTVSEFKDKNGQLAFAYDKSDRAIGVVFTKNGEITKQFDIAKEYPIFGAVTQDTKGNIYIVWGKSVNSNSEKAVFISKYTENGDFVQSVGAAQNGMYGDSGYNVKTPFEGGNCTVTINGNVLCAFYAKKMLSGHQGCAVFAIDLNTMRELDGYSFYESHSFAQRATAYGQGFAFVSKGDCFNRGFVFGIADGSGKVNEMKTFDFWVDRNAYSDYDMNKLNRTYAQLGDVAVTDRGNIALLGISAPSLSSDAKTEVQQLFIQIFNPSGDPATSSTYVTTGTRSGLAGNNGNENVTNYGVQWLTNSQSSYPYNAKLQSLSNGNLAVLYEQYSTSTKKFEGSYYMILSSSGSIVTKPTLIGTEVYLPKYEELILDSNGDICFVSNTVGNNELIIFRIDI